jgi:DNA polymerase-3 subunit epsilon
VLWALIERGAAYGIATLADLLHVQSVRSNPHFEKVKLARSLPRTRGVYLFTNARNEVIYVGKAADLRSRVRSYFTQDERKRMGDLRAEVASVRVIPCATEAHAAGLEARLIATHRPRYNRAGVRRRKPAYLRLTNDRHPRLSVGPNATGLAIGPFASAQRARAAASTLSGLFGLRTCTLRLDGRAHEPCALYDLGSCHGPCTARETDVAAHDRAAAVLRVDLESSLSVACRRMAARLETLAAQSRFEEAAAHRDAFGDLAGAIDRARRLRALADAGRVELDTPEGRVVLDGGRLPDAPESATGDTPTALGLTGLEERRAVAGWFDRAPALRLVSSSAPLAYPWPRVAHLDHICVERPQHQAPSAVQ